MRSVLERFEEKYEVDHNTDCWGWTGATYGDGYGQIWVDGKMRPAHRISWMLHYGTIGRGLCVLHKCDVHYCVNPDHLFLGTRSDNIRDCVKKGRHHETRKTHCPKGHEYTEENTYVYPSGYRGCRVCRRETSRWWVAKARLNRPMPRKEVVFS